MTKTLLRTILLGVIFIGGLVISGWLGVGRLLEARASAEWPIVLGEVVECRTAPPARSGQRWRSTIDYRYELEGEVYRSDRWDVHGERKLDSQAQAEQVAAQHPPGSPIEVRYDPEDPGQAVLAVGGTREAWLTIILGLLVSLVAMRVVTRRMVRGR